MLKCISLGTKPYIDSNTICQCIGIDPNTLLRWLHEGKQSVAMVMTPEGLFVEESGISMIIRRKCIEPIYLDWMRFVKRNGAKRRLTEYEKKCVAIAQKFTCQLCHRIVEDYDIDHIEQDCIRNNNTRSNLQLLCVSCHRQKTREDRLFGDCLFEPYVAGDEKKHSTKRSSEGNLFSAYFHT